MNRLALSVVVATAGGVAIGAVAGVVMPMLGLGSIALPVTVGVISGVVGALFVSAPKSK
jgi:hypothetical protein